MSAFAFSKRKKPDLLGARVKKPNKGNDAGMCAGTTDNQISGYRGTCSLTLEERLEGICEVAPEPSLN